MDLQLQTYTYPNLQKEKTTIYTSNLIWDSIDIESIPIHLLKGPIDVHPIGIKPTNSFQLWVGCFNNSAMDA